MCNVFSRLVSITIFRGVVDREESHHHNMVRGRQQDVSLGFSRRFYLIKLDKRNQPQCRFNN